MHYRLDFNRAASIVRAIRNGDWTMQFPDWADEDRNTSDVIVFGSETGSDHDYTRAVHTAEAFIIFFQLTQPKFDSHKFLIACGLIERTAKRSKA